MKICFLGDISSIHLVRWVEYFRDNGHSVSVISFSKGNISGVEVRYIGHNININGGGGNKQYLKKIGVIKKIVKEIGPDIINAHYLTSYGLIGAIIKDRPLIVSTWGSDILVTPKKNIIYKKLTKYVLKKSNLVTSDSNFMSKEIEELGYPNNKIITSPMGIDINLFNSNGRKVNSTKVFLSMRTLCLNSNIDTIIKAFNIVHKKNKDTKLIITNSGDTKKHILDLINKLRLEDYVDYRGFVSRNDVARLLRESDVYLSIPTSDSTSVNLLEAMNSGILPIVSDLPANREWINNNENGLVLKNIDEIELADLMIKSVENSELIYGAMEINTSIIQDRAIWKNNMQIILDNYNKLIDRGM